MTDAKIISKEAIAIPSIEKVLKSRKKDERAEIQNKVLGHSKKFGKLTETESNKLVQELQGLEIPGLTKEEIIAIADIVPATLTELRSVLSGKANLSPENFKRISDIVVSYTKEKK
jgi:DNA-directed RNA polymerase subunit F